MDLSRRTPTADDIVVPIKVDGLHIGCDCGCFTRVVFSGDGDDWCMWAQDAYYPVRWGPFTKTINVGVEMVLDNPDTVDALIAALVEVRKTL